MKYTVEIGLGTVIYGQYFIKIGLNVQKLLGGHIPGVQRPG
jgi:hypothetical protein